MSRVARRSRQWWEEGRAERMHVRLLKDALCFFKNQDCTLKIFFIHPNWHSPSYIFFSLEICGKGKHQLSMCKKTPTTVIGLRYFNPRKIAETLSPAPSLPGIAHRRVSALF